MEGKRGGGEMVPGQEREVTPIDPTRRHHSGGKGQAFPLQIRLYKTQTPRAAGERSLLQTSAS